MNFCNCLDIRPPPRLVLIKGVKRGKSQPYLVFFMTDKRQIDFLMRGAIVGGTTAAGLAIYNQPAQAIDIAEVNSAMTSIASNSDSVADVAFPIGAAILALSVIAMVLTRFIKIA